VLSSILRQGIEIKLAGGYSHDVVERFWDSIRKRC